MASNKNNDENRGENRGGMAEMVRYLRARYPLIWIVTPDERQVELAVRQIADKRNATAVAWSIATGFEALREDADSPSGDEDPAAALSTVARRPGKALFVFRDFHPFVAPGPPVNVPIIRMVRDLSRVLRSLPAAEARAVIFVSPTVELPPELQAEIAVIEWPLPTRREIESVLRRMLSGQSVEDADIEEAAAAAQGLSVRQLEDAVALSLASEKRLDAAVIAREKRRIVARDSAVQWIDVDEDVEAGGLDVLQMWIETRRRALEPAAREFGLPDPRGALAIGVPGCGKSLCARVTARQWRVPLLRLDVGAVFGAYVGQSESKIRASLAVAEAVAPCILWIDEIEKAFGGTASSGETDGGTTSRVFGTFLTWMQERRSPVFVFATANDVDRLPPEMLRKGRFDEVFFVDLPGFADRWQIAAVHLRKRGRDTDNFNLTAISDATADFSGAEIEAAIVDGLFSAYVEGRELQTDDIIRAAKTTSPLSRVSREKLDRLRKTAKTNGWRLAATPERVTADERRRLAEIAG